MHNSSEPLYLPARKPNNTIDIKGLMKSWDSPRANFPGTHLLGQVAVSREGNINVGGTIDGKTAPTLPPWHDQFFDMIEPGIRRVVTTFVQELGWITYTSCEGHNALATAGWHFRHVGLLPRTPAEYSRVHAICRSLACLSYIQSSSEFTQLGISLGRLHDPNTTSEVIDVIFVPSKGVDWGSYIYGCDRICNWMIEHISANKYSLLSGGGK